MSTVDHPIMLLVLDGWGHSNDPEFNAIYSAHTPTWDRMWSTYPNLLIHCSGADVGLPDEQMGNSEVGHMHLGAGRTIDQDFTRVSRALSDGSFFDNPVLRPALERIAAEDRAFHVLGLLSPGGVHSHEDHIVASIEMAARCGVKRIYLHAFLDGRDTPPRSAAASIEKLEQKFHDLRVGQFASVVGRYLAMDRNQNWDRIASAYKLIVDGNAAHHCSDPLSALEQAYERGENDEFVAPTAITGIDSKPIHLNDGDLIFFANFRADRARQLSISLAQEKFDGFVRDRVVALQEFITMTSYGDQFDFPAAFPPINLNNTFGDWIAARGLRQLRIAETEKYAHVTFFFNGGREEPASGEDRQLIPSPDVATYDLQPEMSAIQVTDKLVEAIASQVYDAIICNYANADMVGHTGNFAATVQCIESLDACLARVVSAAQASGMEILITADHGNAEKMRNAASDQAHTAHTSNLVPLIYIGRSAEMASKGCLSDIAPTMLTLMEIAVPPEMTGRSLVALKKGDQQAA
ncbi:MAG: 2,3-bisphosphoglycerate-independent phosphoglycerate mutase [Proteobacteria bacterium]|nr:2,3-bisphosphoglycerate-independent phosphoglycerate mutase [Pseudomonadota bacterium]